MNNHTVIKQLEEVIQLLKDDNNYVVRHGIDTGLNIGKIHNDPLVGLCETGKHIKIEVDIDYKEYKSLEII